MLTQEQAQQIAIEGAREKGWPEKGRVLVRRRRRFFVFGKVTWHASFLFMRAKLCGEMSIDDETGAIVSASTMSYR